MTFIVKGFSPFLGVSLIDYFDFDYCWKSFLFPYSFFDSVVGGQNLGVLTFGPDLPLRQNKSTCLIVGTCVSSRRGGNPSFYLGRNSLSSIVNIRVLQIK
jgi:hypothetical protein